MQYSWNFLAKDITKKTVTDINGNKVWNSDDFTLVKYFFPHYTFFIIYLPKIKMSIIGYIPTDGSSGSESSL